MTAGAKREGAGDQQNRKKSLLRNHRAQFKHGERPLSWPVIAHRASRRQRQPTGQARPSRSARYSFRSFASAFSPPKRIAPATRNTRLPRPIAPPAKNGSSGMPTAPEARVNILNGTGVNPAISSNQKPLLGRLLLDALELAGVAHPLDQRHRQVDGVMADGVADEHAEHRADQAQAGIVETPARRGHAHRRQHQLGRHREE